MKREFATRRMGATVNYASASSAWMRNRNAVRHEPRATLGPVSHTIVVVILVLVVGLIYVTQGAKTVSYDYEAKGVSDEIAALEAERNSLAAENARIVAGAAGESNEVASAMVDAKSSGFAQE